MEFKYAILLSTLIALTGLPCWSAADLGNQTANAMANAAERGDAQRVRQLAPLAIAANATFDKVSDDVLIEIARLLDPKSLGRLAQVSIKFRDIVASIFIYKLLKEHRGNLETASWEAYEKENQDAIDYLKNAEAEAEKKEAFLKDKSADENERDYNEWLEDQFQGDDSFFEGFD